MDIIGAWIGLRCRKAAHRRLQMETASGSNELEAVFFYNLFQLLWIRKLPELVSTS